MYYIEFVEPVEGVPIERFRQALKESSEEWARQHPEDELVLNLARTWRMGPNNTRYLTIWKIEDFGAFQRWQEEFATAEAATKLAELRRLLRVVEAGVYEDLGSEIL